MILKDKIKKEEHTNNSLQVTNVITQRHIKAKCSCNSLNNDAVIWKQEAGLMLNNLMPKASWYKTKTKICQTL